MARKVRPTLTEVSRENARYFANISAHTFVEHATMLISRDNQAFRLLELADRLLLHRLTYSLPFYFIYLMNGDNRLTAQTSAPHTLQSTASIVLSVA